MSQIELFDHLLRISIIYKGLFFVPWNHTTVRKLFVFDKNTWYLMIVYKKVIMLISTTMNEIP